MTTRTHVAGFDPKSYTNPILTNFLFEKYWQTHPGRPSRPYLSINKYGQITLSAAGSALLGHPRFAVLFFDRGQGVIGIQAGTELDGLKMSRNVKGSNHTRLSGMGFCAHFGIPHGLKSLPVELHGNTLIARLPRTEPTS